MKIITGYTGERQITSDNDASIFTGIVGKNNYVLNTLNNLAYQLMGNNVIRIKSGVVNYGGRYGIVEEYEDVQFENGKQGVTRTDMLVARYEKDEVTGIESMKLVMIAGTSSVAAKPLSTDFPLYQITLSGINVASVVPQFDILLSMQELKALIESTANSITSAYTNALNSAVTTLRTEYKNADTAMSKSLTTAFQNAYTSINSKIDNLTNTVNRNFAEIASDTNQMRAQLDNLESRVARLESK